MSTKRVVVTLFSTNGSYIGTEDTVVVTQQMDEYITRLFNDNATHSPLYAIATMMYSGLTIAHEVWYNMPGTIASCFSSKVL